ncbi:MAG TPA: O-antigen ligase family protein [Gaiellaceae bacterium]|nr:O-antigen ligase family protein [Gaiellaceae bacterium]
MTRGERLAGGALLVLVVGLALHNALMAQLFELGLRGRALDAAAAWKEALLLAAVLAAAGNVRRLRPTLPDLLALVYTAVVCLYALLPQEVLGGEATGRGELLALRHHLLPVAAYALGRLLSPASSERERLGAAAALTAGLVALVGLADLALVSLDSWRRSGVPGWYREQLGLDYQGLSGLPENWVYNTGDEEHPLRRLVSTFLSPLASAYAFLVALLYVAARPLRWWWPPLAALLFVALLYTHTRAALLALVAGLLVLALAGRRPAPAALAVGAAALGAAFLAAYPALAPATSYTQAELEWQRENAQRNPGASGDPFSGSEASTRSHLRNLREGVATVLRHPQGYGLGNAGVVAKRTGVEIKAGESTYTELGVDAGLAGAAAFLLFGAALLRALWRRAPWVAASLAAVLLLALQTDVIGVHWLAVVVWAAAGLAVAARPGPPKAHEAGVVPGARAGESGGGGA